jgi:ppGpp synthetase/RelA/SpoT-type nucleotidyltranferase
MDVNEIVGLWEQDEPNFNVLGKLVHLYIKSTITEYEILPEISFRTKDLLSIIKKIKKKQSEKEYTYNDLKDKLGLRIICTYKEDLEKVDSFLKENFIIKKAEYKKDILDFDKLDYTSNHYDASINANIAAFQNHNHLKDLVFEIQVRTLNQHAWSNTAHTLAYKQEAEIPPLLKRRVYRLLSLYEIADDEFSSVNAALSNNPDNIVYTLLRKLESKIYKYAKLDFDRTMSLRSIKIILSYLSPDQQQNLFKNIEAFITDKSEKIIQIFNENRIRFYEIPNLTQPEIFIIWYCLEKFYFEIKDNWDSDFDLFDLEQLANIWGTSIN